MPSFARAMRDDFDTASRRIAHTWRSDLQGAARPRAAYRKNGRPHGAAHRGDAATAKWKDGFSQARPTRARHPCRILSDCATRKMPQRHAEFQPLTTRLAVDPRPSIPHSTRSPASRKHGGDMPMPTPPGVPVAITSPGSKVMNRLM